MSDRFRLNVYVDVPSSEPPLVSLALKREKADDDPKVFARSPQSPTTAPVPFSMRGGEVFGTAVLATPARGLVLDFQHDGKIEAVDGTGAPTWKNPALIKFFHPKDASNLTWKVEVLLGKAVSPPSSIP